MSMLTKRKKRRCVVRFIEIGSSEMRKWRAGWDSNPRRACTLAGFQDQCIQPLCHLPVAVSDHVIA